MAAVAETEAIMRIEPDWSSSPDWALYFAIDANGNMYWYDGEPNMVGDMWEGDVCNQVGTIIINNWTGTKTYEDYPAWRKSLCRRP